MTKWTRISEMKKICFCLSFLSALESLCFETPSVSYPKKIKKQGNEKKKLYKGRNKSKCISSSRRPNLKTIIINRAGKGGHGNRISIVLPNWLSTKIHVIGASQLNCLIRYLYINCFDIYTYYIIYTYIYEEYFLISLTWLYIS